MIILNFIADPEDKHGLVDNSETDAPPEYQTVKAHIVFNIKDKPEALVDALRLLSDVSNNSVASSSDTLGAA